MSNSRLTTDQVRHVAALAKLRLSAEQIDAFRSQLDSILDYMASLDGLAVENVEPTYHTVLEQVTLREDARETSLSRDEVLRQAPAHENGGFRVPRVLEES